MTSHITAAAAETFAERRARYETERPGFSRNTAWVAAVIDALESRPAHAGLPREQITVLRIDGHPVSLVDFDRLFEELTQLHQALGSAMRERDEATNAADELAYAVAPVSVIGEHGADDPWQNALEILGQQRPAAA